MEYNIYCDESCHLRRDGNDIMVLGASWCDQKYKKIISDEIRKIKMSHGVSSYFEVKWTKVSMGKVDLYLDLLQYFITNEHINFRGVLARGKKTLDHGKYNKGDYDLWYYKMYFLLLDHIISPNNQYRIYIDIKDTHGGPRIKKLHEVLCNNIYDFNCECVRSVAQINSNESELMQLADLLIGAVSYENRHLYEDDCNKAKKLIIDELSGRYSLTNSSPYSNRKFNLFVWEGKHNV